MFNIAIGVEALFGMFPLLLLFVATGGLLTTIVSIRSSPTVLGSVWSPVAAVVVLVIVVPLVPSFILTVMSKVALLLTFMLPIVQIPEP